MIIPGMRNYRDITGKGYFYRVRSPTSNFEGQFPLNFPRSKNIQPKLGSLEFQVCMYVCIYIYIST